MRCVYLAGPIAGHTFDEATDWREAVQLRLYDAGAALGDSDGWMGLSPMRAKEKFNVPGPLASNFDEGKAAVMRDLNDIRRSDAVLVNLAGAERVSIGTMAEMGYAFAERKFILVVMPAEERPTCSAPVCTNPACVVPNPHDHIFVHEMASQIVPTLDDALDVLLAL